MCLLRETGEKDGLLGQGVLKMYIDMADAGRTRICHVLYMKDIGVKNKGW